MKKSSTSFRFSSSLLFFFIVAASIAVYSEAADCVYVLTVQTGAVFEAGTDSIIGVTFNSFTGPSVEIPDLKKWGMYEPGYDYFKQGNRDLFRGTGPCIYTPVCNITVTSDGNGQEPGWYLEYVNVLTILVKRTNIMFEFHQWLANDELTASRDVCGSSTNKRIDF